MNATVQAMDEAGRRAGRILTVALAVALIGVYGWQVIAAVWPSSYWFEVRQVVVNDTVAGVSPTMAVDRTIHTSFRGWWVAEVEKQQSHGGFSVVCAQSGRNNYNADAGLPDALDLDWWTYPLHCELTPGRYRVDTTWSFSPASFPEKHVHYVSNEFLVMPANCRAAGAPCIWR